MKKIREMPIEELPKLVKFVNENWNYLGKRPRANEEEKKLEFWQKFHHNNRILTYPGEQGEIIGLLTLSKENEDIYLDHLNVITSLKRQGYGVKLLQLADHIARIWGGNRIIILGRQDQGDFFDYFLHLGYGFHCPISEKEHIILEKKIIASDKLHIII